MQKLSSYVAEKAKADIQIGGSTFSFTYFVMVRARFTDEEWQALIAMKGREYLKVLIPKVLISWDVVDDDDHQIPVTAEAIEQHQMPDELLQAINQRVFGSDLSGKVTSSSSPVT